MTVAVVDVAPAAHPDMDAEAIGRLGAHAARVAAEVIERERRPRRASARGFPARRSSGFRSRTRTMRSERCGRLPMHRQRFRRSTTAGRRPKAAHYRSRAGIEAGDIVVAGAWGHAPRCRCGTAGEGCGSVAGGCARWRDHHRPVGAAAPPGRGDREALRRAPRPGPRAGRSWRSSPARRACPAHTMHRCSAARAN